MIVFHGKIAAAALLALAAGTLGASAEPVLYGTTAKVLKYGSGPLAPPQQATFDWLSDHGNYFGAMAISTKDGESFAVRGYNSLQAATKIAKRSCELRSGGACDIYATLVPIGFKGDVSSTKGVSYGAEKYYSTPYMDKLKAPGYGAVAVSEASQMGVSWGQASPASAQEAALASCKAVVARNLADGSPTVRKVVETNHMTDCKVVQTLKN
ncbi:DUF4189 domain-containing protein [Acidimangrovimonas sediminis]|uniref:DUF4189 domain-containing protein n=1 Tax=Acidimangrovimonas sediminis TaxID=2056283 RepID=UPI001304EFA3|nr:DUF4189 domain-containing protein [Acidimangrovimonas sediminis]